MTVSHILGIVIYIFLVSVVTTVGIWLAPIPVLSIIGWTLTFLYLGLVMWWRLSIDIKKARLPASAEGIAQATDATSVRAQLDDFPEQFRQAILDCGSVVTQGPVRLTFKDSSAHYHSARRYLDEGYVERACNEYDSACRYLRLAKKFATEMAIAEHSVRM